jgi:hypothetical protein
VWWIPWLLATGVFVAVEFHQIRGQLAHGQTVADGLLQSDVDALVYFALLASAPLVSCLGSRKLALRMHLSGYVATHIRSLAARCAATSGTRVRAFCLSIMVGAVSLAASAAVGTRFADLPPAFHDEYSYLFQARSFLAGHISYPSHAAARLFDQMHVLNEGRFASRYFPGTGMWLAPFLAAGHPYFGHWLAGAICAVLMFWIGRELGGDGAGLVAGLLTALSPGMALFSNLLLAHQPTLVGLGLFLLGALHLLRSGSAGWGIVSGTGLAFAMLCRPMTAAGVAFPFGVYFLWWACRSPSEPGVERSPSDSEEPQIISGPVPQADAGKRGRRVKALAALGLPLLAAAIGLFFYDRTITGSGLLTPYSLYTDIYTPRHVYGFNNVVRGEKHLGPRVVENYDKWAENLTPALAATNAVRRLTASWKWTLGIIPLALVLAGGLVLWRRMPRGAWLIFASIVSLHAAHIPYWFVGIEEHHYVFESGPLWGVWTAVVSLAAVAAWRASRHAALAWWWGTLLVSAVVMNFEASGMQHADDSGTDLHWSAPLDRAVREIRFARRKHGRFLELVARRAHPRPALVLVESDPADRHIDYVINTPDLAGPVLIGHFLPESAPIAELKNLFPDRSLFLYKVREDDWRRID